MAAHARVAAWRASHTKPPPFTAAPPPCVAARPQERGYNALWLYRVRDCWARDITTIHADSSVLTQESESLTVTGLSIEARRTRANDIPNEYNERADADGHWGVGATHTFDLLVDGFETHCRVGGRAGGCMRVAVLQACSLGGCLASMQACSPVPDPN